MSPVRTRLSPRRRLLPCAATLALLFAPGAAAAAPIVIDGDVPAGGPDHFFVDFDVPAGTKEIEVRHDDRSDANILDWGLDDPNGYRGWGGGTSEPAIVGELAASRAYVAGPIQAGKWRVVVGKAKVVASPAVYHVEIELRTAPTLPPFTDRAPYAPVPALETGYRYYAGDLHAHSRESTDATPPIADMIALAKSRGLDFLEVSDHNTVTQLDQLDALQAREPHLLLVPGIEFTTYAGHANAIGATRWVDHKIGQPGVTIGGAADAIRAQGALFSVNHPALDLGDLCIGCAWKHDLDPTKIDGVEIETGGWAQGGVFFTEKAIAFWDALLDQGRKIPALGGSDDHRAGQQGGGGAESPIGDPTTLVRARELSVDGILEALRKGATVVKLQGPGDPMVELETAAQAGGGDANGWPGDTLAVRSVVLRARVTGGRGAALRWVKNGKPDGDPVAIDADPFVAERVVEPPADGEDRWRAEALVDDKPRTVTSHVWLRRDPAGPEVSAPGDGGGCRTAAGSDGSAAAALAIAFAAATATTRRRRRRA